MMPIKTYNKIEMIVLYFVMKKNLEISCQNGSEHETTSFTWAQFLITLTLFRLDFEAFSTSLELVFFLAY